MVCMVCLVCMVYMVCMVYVVCMVYMVCMFYMFYMLYMVCIVCGSCRVHRAAITDTFYSEELIAANYKTDTLWPHWNRPGHLLIIVWNSLLSTSFIQHTFSVKQNINQTFCKMIPILDHYDI